MTTSTLNKNVHARVQNRLRHRGLAGIARARGEWDITREEIATGGTPKEIAKRATARIIAAREASEMLEDLALAPIAHDPIAEAAAWMPRV